LPSGDQASVRSTDGCDEYAEEGVEEAPPLEEEKAVE
jgi:hypothetical protein